MRPVEELLREGISAGQFGGDCKPHGEHAMGFVRFLDDPKTSFAGHVVDIGSGAGLPALILADAFPETHWTLVERRDGRADLLRRAVQRLELDDRVDVRAEDVALAAWSELRGSADWVTARSFGPPGDTAECATGFLKPGGQLLTSEPFDGDIEQRWPTSGLEACGLALTGEWETNSGRYARFTRSTLPIYALPRKGSRKRLLF